MWKLQPAESESGVFYLLPGKEYVVGRKNCDILLANDQSISRVHAKLTVTEQTVTLKDSSKYGTFINDEQLAAGSTKTLRGGDRVTFGVFQSKFRLELNSVVVCSSCVDNEGKLALSQAVQSVGGRLVSSWSQDCTHLVMPTVKVTVKTICALLCCRPIVKPEFFTELSQAVQRKETFPKSENFKPEMDEPSLAKQEVDLGPRPERKSLFKDKTFVFLNAKQMKRLSQAITCGGGRSQLLEEGSLPVSLLESAGTCVLDVGTGSSQALIPSTTKKWTDSVGQILHRNGLRFITESEIGLAAIYVSNQTYCNPCSSMDSESVRMRSAIPAATLTQNTTVDETVLPAASQNITAYVANTETSQSFSRMHGCGAIAVGETPEKCPVQAEPLRSAKPASTLSRRQLSTMEPPTTSESVKSSLTSSERVQEKKAESASSDRRNDDCVKFPDPLNSSATLKQSPQKQSALTSYFQPVSKKRSREHGADSELSEAKLSRRECEDEENEKKNATPAASLQTSHTNQKRHGTTPQSNFSASLGLGSALAMSSGPSGDHNAQNYDSNPISGSKKRKEPVQDQPSNLGVQEERTDLDVSLEELESIMSEDMDEPMQPAASKKQRLGQGESSTSSKERNPKQYHNTISSNQQRVEQQSIASKSQNLQQGVPDGANKHQNSKRKLQGSGRAADLEQDQLGSVHRKDRSESDNVKEEEVSFVEISEALNGFAKHSEVPAVKQESKGSSSASASENDTELPQRLLQVQFKCLTVNAPSRTRSDPLQNRDPNGKNFKRFRKVPVPGLHGLPSIIGGSDLVAHNRSKNTELEDWLRDAAEEEKRQEREETLGDDLFRYNPKPSKRR